MKAGTLIIKTLVDKSGFKKGVDELEDEEPELAVRFKISSIPTLMLFENGQVRDMLVGYRPKADIESMLK